MEAPGGHDAAPPPDAGPDSAAPPDGGDVPDAAADAQVEPECALALDPPDGADTGTAQSANETPRLVRVGDDAFGLVVRGEDGIVATFVSAAGELAAGPVGPLDDGEAGPEIATAATAVGGLLVVWRVGTDGSLAGSIVDGGGAADVGTLSDATDVLVDSPAVGRSSAGFVLAWIETRDGAGVLATRPLDANGLPAGDSVAHTTDGTDGAPGLADSVDEDVPIAWADDASGAPRLQAGLRLADGSIEAREVSTATIDGGADVVASPLGVFLSWVEPSDGGGGLRAVHVTRFEGEIIQDRVIARNADLAEHTSIAWDGERVLVGWHTGAVGAVEATIAAVAPDLQVIDTLVLPGASVRPDVAAGPEARSVAWLDSADRTVRVGALSCE